MGEVKAPDIPRPEKREPATVYCVLRSDCDCEDELNGVFDSWEAAQDFADHQQNAYQYYVHEYTVQTENLDVGPVVWTSSIPLLDIETDLAILKYSGFHPGVDRSERDDLVGWIQYACDKIFFWFYANNRTEATMKARDLANTIIKNEAEGKYPYLRRQVFRLHSGNHGLYYPYYDYTTGEIILPKNGCIEIARNDLQFDADGNILSPKIKEVDKTIL